MLKRESENDLIFGIILIGITDVLVGACPGNLPGDRDVLIKTAGFLGFHTGMGISNTFAVFDFFGSRSNITSKGMLATFFQIFPFRPFFSISTLYE